ncbi:hypothetical protein BCR32DRAFT_292103 [Anaeromyces robustus]|uniref:Uncharacterized protein n=1 Tax=Anaeromyces robustus TaxID=1754192 RepID=A0A1Y1XC41_9FUNG|nr:hypothetical protein BCR32DRAFT_292103 [Anaeromyces robustus]|eukprot:ORX83287.1 hypothetical protein BCR32DRAFT_292103 [Anaeromyces robustus]
MKSLTFALVILTLTLLSCVSGKTLDYNENEDKLNPISSTTTTTTTTTTTNENDINSLWENVYSFLDNLNIPVDYMFQDIESLGNNPSLTMKDSLVVNSLITSLFNKGADANANADADANANAYVENENENENESRLQRRGCRCNCAMAGNCQCECGDKVEAVSEGEKKCFKEATGVDLDSLAPNKIKEAMNGAFSMITLLKSVCESIWKAPVAVAKYEYCLIKQL